MKAVLRWIAVSLLLGSAPGASGAVVPSDGGAVDGPPSRAATQGCGDLLARLGRKPAALAYTGCKAFPRLQGAPLRATYAVSGRQAMAVEAYLIRATHLNPLKRSCCQWDSAPAGFTDGHGGQFSIAMVSAETVVTRRADWGKIATFRVTVEMLTDAI